MALVHSPSIVRQGLQFLFDMASPSSFKGAPTTNITPALGLIGVQSVTPTYVGNEGSWRKYSLTGTWTAGTYPYSLAVSTTPLTGGVSYSTGCYIKTNVPHKFVNLFTGMNYVNQPMNNVGVSFSVPQRDGSVYVGRTNFQYTSTVNETGYLLSQPVIGIVFNPATDFVYIKDGQIEQSTFNTPYVNGTRSNTQAIIDIAGGNTITANSLTYNTDNTFRFNGAGNYISLPTSLNYTSSFSAFAWFKSTGAPRGGYHIVFGPTEFELSIPTGGSIRTGVVTSTGRIVTDHGSGLVDGNWHYVGVTVDGANKVSYIDGASVGSVSITGILVSNIASRSMGVFGQGDTTYGTNGYISSAHVYNRALTAAEVKQNFNALRGRYGV